VPRTFPGKELLVASGCTQDNSWLMFATVTHHSKICLLMCIGLLVWFINSLKDGTYRQQFSSAAFAIVVAGYIATSISCLMGLQHFGLVWIMYVYGVMSFNDAGAYFAGSAFGRTPLIKLSPNKTVEGYIGGAVVTVVLTYLYTRLIFDKPYMVCPVEKLSFKPFFYESCEIPLVYSL